MDPPPRYSAAVAPNAVPAVPSAGSGRSSPSANSASDPGAATSAPVPVPVPAPVSRTATVSTVSQMSPVLTAVSLPQSQPQSPQSQTQIPIQPQTQTYTQQTQPPTQPQSPSSVPSRQPPQPPFPAANTAHRPAPTTTTATASRSPPAPTPSKGLTYRRAKPLFLTVSMIATTSLSWILLYIADSKATSSMASSVSDATQGSVTKLMRAAWILHTVGALIALSAATTLLSIAAVSLTTRRRANQFLNVRQVFALADARWLSAKLRARHSRETGLFSALACALTVVAVATPFLQAILVHDGMRHVLYCANGGAWTPFCAPSLGYLRIPSMVARTTSTAYMSGWTETIGATVVNLQQPWNNALVHGSNTDPLVLNASDLGMWVSTVSKSLVTGPIRQATIRTSTSASCQAVAYTEWPLACSTYNSSDVGSGHGYYSQFSVGGATGRVCAPPDVSKSWKDEGTLQHSATETVYIGFTLSPEISVPKSLEIAGFRSSNYSLQCKGTAQSGFYEIPNAATDFADGAEYTSARQIGPQVFVPLIASWSTFNDIGPYSPFRLAVLALFGARSYLQDVLTTTFNSGLTGVVPELKCSASPLNSAISGVTLVQPTDIGQTAFLLQQACVQNVNFLNEEASHWNTIRLFFGALADADRAQAALKLSMDAAYLAIHGTPKPSDVVANQVPVIGGEGHMMPAPAFGRASMVVLWLLTGLEIVLLAVALGWAAHRRTWTATLDAFAVARLASDLAKQGDYMPPLGFVSADDVARLEDVPGLVGVVPAEQDGDGDEDGVEMESLRSSFPSAPAPAPAPVSAPLSAAAIQPSPAPPPAMQPAPAPVQAPLPPPPPPLLPIPWTPESAAEAALVVDGPANGPNNSEIPQELTMPETLPGSSPAHGFADALPPSYASISGPQPPVRSSSVPQPQPGPALLLPQQNASLAPPLPSPASNASNSSSTATMTSPSQRHAPYRLSVGAAGVVGSGASSPAAAAAAATTTSTTTTTTTSSTTAAQSSVSVPATGST